MKLEQWTLFIDMMGYGQMNGAIKSKEEANTFIAFMKSNVALMNNQDNDQMRQTYSQSRFNLYDYYDIKVLFVSDSVMITYDPKEVSTLYDENLRIMHSANTLFIILQRLQLYMYNCMREKHILIRGGISGKYAMIDDHFAVGEGIIDAYILESKKAIYPRIVLSKAIIDNDLLMRSIRFLSMTLYQIKSIVEVGEDGMSYLDYMAFNIRCALQGGINPQTIQSYNAYLGLHKETIEFHTKVTNEELERLYKEEPKDIEAIAGKEKVLDKYIWLKAYHNRKIKMFDNENLIERFYIA